MAIGDDAASAGMDLVPSSGAAGSAGKVRQGWEQLNKTRDYIAQFFARVWSGVRDATTAAEVRANLGVQGAVDAVNGATATATEGELVVWGNGGRLNVVTPVAGANPTTKSYVDAAVGSVDLSSRVAKTGDTMTGQLYLPASFAAASSYTVAYINGDGRVSRGASSERYKKHISARDPLTLGALFAAPFSRFQMRTGDGSWRYGYIAEQLVGTDMEPFVIVIDGQVESIDFIGLLLAQVAQLNARLAALESDDA